MADLTPLTFAERARSLAANPELDDALAVIVELALETVGCDFASVTLVHADGSLETTAASHPVVERADALQYSLGEGPCLAAATTNRTFVIQATATDRQWPRWSRAVAELGLGAVLSIHLFTDEQMLGALNLYAGTDHVYDSDEIETATIVAAHVSVALARLRLQSDLWKAIDARHLVGMAQGILMERYAITAEQAFSVLRRYSQNSNVRLHIVAQQVVTTRALPPSERDLAIGQEWAETVARASPGVAPRPLT